MDSMFRIRVPLYLFYFIYTPPFSTTDLNLGLPDPRLIFITTLCWPLKHMKWLWACREFFSFSPQCGFMYLGLCGRCFVVLRDSIQININISPIQNVQATGFTPFTLKITTVEMFWFLMYFFPSPSPLFPDFLACTGGGTSKHYRESLSGSAVPNWCRNCENHENAQDP